MTASWSSEALSYDPERGSPPHELENWLGGLGEEPSAVLMIAGPAASASGWSDRAVVAIARRYSETRGRAQLLDLHIERPRLHDLLGESNTEGVADIFLFGASPEHVTLTSKRYPFEFIPAGPFASNPTAVLKDALWERLLARAAATGRSVFLYAPANAAGLESLAAHVRRTVLLGDVEEDAAGAALVSAAEKPVRLRPPQPTEAEPGAAAASAEAKGPARESFERIRLPRDREREALIADLRTRQRTALTAPGSERLEGGPVRVFAGPPPAPPPEPTLTEPPPPARETPSGRTKNPVALTLMAVLLLAALAASWHLGRTVVERRRAAATQQAAPAPADPQPTGEPAGDLLPYSVAIEAHQDLPTAAARIASLTRADSTLGFYIAPILIDSALYYRVMAGPVRDSVAAAELMQLLVTRRMKTGQSPWDIRATPYAFLVGEYELREQAEARLAELHRLDIPGYIIEVPYTNGPSRWYLYSGAYSGPAEADVMRQLLRSAGLPDNLVERKGRSIS